MTMVRLMAALHNAAFLLVFRACHSVVWCSISAAILASLLLVSTSRCSAEILLGSMSLLSSDIARIFRSQLARAGYYGDSVDSNAANGIHMYAARVHQALMSTLGQACLSVLHSAGRGRRRMSEELHCSSYTSHRVRTFRDQLAKPTLINHMGEVAGE